MARTGMDRTLLVAGALLFLFGLLQGGVIDRFENPRMALSAHLTAVQSGMAMMIVGGIWAAVTLGPRLAAITRWSIAASMFGLWAGLTLSAATGAGRALPIAGSNYAADAQTETVVEAIVLGSSGLMIAGWGLLVAGLIRSKPGS